MGDHKDIEEIPRNSVESIEDGLTGIPQGIHWPATDESGGSEIDELDRIAVDNFLDALAQVALSVATRRAIKEQGEDS